MTINAQKQQRLDNELRELALVRFDLFCTLAGVDKLQAYVCLERSKGRTYGQIAQELGMSRSTVQSKCKKCG